MQANLYALYCHAPIIVMPRQLLQLTEADAESEGKGDCRAGQTIWDGVQGLRVSLSAMDSALFLEGHGASQPCGQTFLLILSQCQLHGSFRRLLRRLLQT